MIPPKNSTISKSGKSKSGEISGWGGKISGGVLVLYCSLFYLLDLSFFLLLLDWICTITMDTLTDTQYH